MDDELLAEQQAFYRAKAPEYDEWWKREGSYDRGPELSAEWDRQVAVVADALRRFDARGDVLELAGGTGWWTHALAQTADRLSVVDGSPETLALNRMRVGRADVEYHVADIFEWQPERTYDVVFFSFWLSHVPRTRFSQFWSLVRACLAPDGRVFLIDNRNDPTPGPVRISDPHVVEYETDLHVRKVKDGTEFRVVKVMYEPDELTQLVNAEGFDAQIDATRWFIYGSAQPR